MTSQYFEHDKILYVIQYYAERDKILYAIQYYVYVVLYSLLTVPLTMTGVHSCGVRWQPLPELEVPEKDQSKRRPPDDGLFLPWQ